MACLTVYTEYRCIYCNDKLTLKVNAPTDDYKIAQEYALVKNDYSDELLEFERLHSKHINPNINKYNRIKALV